MSNVHTPRRRPVSAAPGASTTSSPRHRRGKVVRSPSSVIWIRETGLFRRETQPIAPGPAVKFRAAIDGPKALRARNCKVAFGSLLKGLGRAARPVPRHLPSSTVGVEVLKHPRLHIPAQSSPGRGQKKKKKKKNQRRPTCRSALLARSRRRLPETPISWRASSTDGHACCADTLSFPQGPLLRPPRLHGRARHDGRHGQLGPRPRRRERRRPPAGPGDVHRRHLTAPSPARWHEITVSFRTASSGRRFVAVGRLLPRRQPNTFEQQIRGAAIRLLA